MPHSEVTVNLAPADLPKAGSAFDLPISLGVLIADGKVSMQDTGVVAVGELALDGRVRASRGVLGAALVAARRGFPSLVPDVTCIRWDDYPRRWAHWRAAANLHLLER